MKQQSYPPCLQPGLSARGAVVGRAQMFGAPGLFPRERGLQGSTVPGAVSTKCYRREQRPQGSNAQQTSAELTQLAGHPTVTAKARSTQTERANTVTATMERIPR